MIRFLLLFIFLLSSSPSLAIESPSPLNDASPGASLHAVTAETPSPSPTDASLLDAAVRARQESLKQLTEPSEGEKLVDQAELEKMEAALQKSMVEGMEQSVLQDIEDIKEDLEEKSKSFDALLEKLNHQISLSPQEISTLQNGMGVLEKEKQGLQAELKKKEGSLQNLNAEIDRLNGIEQIKDLALQQAVSLKRELDELALKKHEEKMDVFYFSLLVFVLLYLGKIFFSRKYGKEYPHYFAYFDIFYALGFFSFLIWFLFYMKPELLVMLVFLAGAILLIMQEFIVSLLSSFFIVNQYAIGDRVRYEGGEGVIIQLTPFRVVLRVIDEHGFSFEEERRIPNSLFVKQEVVKIPNRFGEKTTLSLVLRNVAPRTFSTIISTIEDEILKKNLSSLPGKSSSKRYHVDFSYSGEGRPNIFLAWEDLPEKNREIKQKIMEYINAMSSGEDE